MSYRFLTAGLIVISLFLAGCGGGDFGQPPTGPAPGPGEQKVGRPYQIGGIWYYPSVDDNYDEVGVASWYGPQFHGRPTANGEVFDMNKVTAAHPTLPLPSRVRVTNLENGRSIVVRVNDRGPFAKGRIIDLSRRSAQLLGFQGQGTTRVRVQLVRPDGSIADKGGARRTQVARRLGEDDEILGPLYVQVGAFSNYDNARRLRRRLSRLGDVDIQSASVGRDTVYRVRFGPFDDLPSAQSVLDRVLSEGFHGARIFTDRLG